MCGITSLTLTTSTMTPIILSNVQHVIILINGPTPAHEIQPHDECFNFHGDVAKFVVCEVTFVCAYCSIIPEFYHCLRNYVRILVEYCVQRDL